MEKLLKILGILFCLFIMPYTLSVRGSVFSMRGFSSEKTNQPTKQEKRAARRADKKAAQHVADYIVSQEFVMDVNGLVNRSADPLKEYIRNYFFHCDFHKDQLIKMKQCFGEFDQLLQESLPICAHALFSYVVSDAIAKHVQTTAQNALDTRAMAIYAAPSIMEHIEGQDGVLTRKEKEQFIVLKAQWNSWYERWSEFLMSVSMYVETRTELREQFLDEHKKSLLFSLLWKHAGPGIWFLISQFRVARIMFGSSVQDANYFLMKLMLRLHKNVMTRRDALEEKVIARTKESLRLYTGIINKVIDERLAYF